MGELQGRYGGDMGEIWVRYRRERVLGQAAHLLLRELLVDAQRGRGALLAEQLLALGRLAPRRLVPLAQDA